MKRTYLMLLWHMHQPFYKDLVEGYTRCRGCASTPEGLLRHGCPAERVPCVHCDFQFCPSFAAQLEEYARVNGPRTGYEAALKPANDLSREKRLCCCRLVSS